MTELKQLLEVYSLEEILENLDLTEEDVLELLNEAGYLSKFSMPEPL